MTPVFRVWATTYDYEKISQANAVLIDRDQGLFVTNAHLVNAHGLNPTDNFLISLPHTGHNYKALFSERWVDWDADLAYLCLKSADLSSYPDLTRRKEECGRYEATKIVVNMPVTSSEALTDGPLTIPALVINSHSTYGVTAPNLRQRWEALENRRSLGKEDRPILYEDYIHLLAVQNIVQGMSGGAVLDRDDRLVGILSKSAVTSGRCLAIPASRFITSLPPEPEAIVEKTAGPEHPGPLSVLYNWLVRRGRPEIKPATPSPGTPQP